MYYTIRQMAQLFGVTEHTLRFYTDQGLLPCTRDGGNRRVFNEESVNWMQGIQCLKGCGASIEDIQAYCRLCLAEESEENLRARYAIILKQREEAYKRVEEAKATAKVVALSAVKYGDLSNQASKDYIFDIDRFTSFEGNTGPYILYTIVRIKSILNKYKEAGKEAGTAAILPAHSESEKALMLELTRFNAMMENAYEETAPHKVCSYIYDLANALNHFYHETKIMAEEDEAVQASYVRLLTLTRRTLEVCIDVLGFSAPDRM